MISYRTLVFGTIAVISAAAPAAAHPLSPVPAPATTSSVRVSHPAPIAKPAGQTLETLVVKALQGLTQWEQSIFQLHR